MSAVLFLLLLGVVVGRPPLSDEELRNIQPVAIEYFDDLISPWLINSTKLKENLMYEKKKYLSTVLGIHNKVRRL